MQPPSITTGWLIKQGGSKVRQLPRADAAPELHLCQPVAASDSLSQGGFKTWKKRWFVLSQSELMYYSQPSRKELKGCMVIADCVVVHVPPSQVPAAPQRFRRLRADPHVRAGRISLLHQRAHGGARAAAALQQRRGG
jgi:hypothetical protein